MPEKIDTPETTPAANPNPNPPPAPQPAAERKAGKGDLIKVVCADGTHAVGEIVKPGKGGLADVSFTHRGLDVTITSSPFDPAGKRPDSWHFVD